MATESSPIRPERLAELAAVTKEYAKFDATEPRGLARLPGAVLAVAGGALLLARREVGFVLVCAMPAVWLAGSAMGNGRYQQFGHVEPFSYVDPPKRWPMWALAGAFWSLGVIAFALQRGRVPAFPPPPGTGSTLATVAAAAMLATLPLVAWVLRWKVSRNDVYAAGLLSFYVVQYGASGALAPIMLFTLGLGFGGLAVWEHRRFRWIEARMLALREAP